MDRIDQFDIERSAVTQTHSGSILTEIGPVEALNDGKSSGSGTLYPCQAERFRFMSMMWEK